MRTSLRLLPLFIKSFRMTLLGATTYWLELILTHGISFMLIIGNYIPGSCHDLKRQTGPPWFCSLIVLKFTFEFEENDLNFRNFSGLWLRPPQGTYYQRNQDAKYQNT